MELFQCRLFLPMELWKVQWSPTFPVRILVVDGFESSGQSSGQSSSQSSDQSSGQSSGHSSDQSSDENSGQSSGQIFSYIYFLKPQALLIIFFDFFLIFSDFFSIFFFNIFSILHFYSYIIFLLIHTIFASTGLTFKFRSRSRLHCVSN